MRKNILHRIFVIKFSCFAEKWNNNNWLPFFDKITLIWIFPKIEKSGGILHFAPIARN
jgi:hypothetical protein